MNLVFRTKKRVWLFCAAAVFLLLVLCVCQIRFFTVRGNSMEPSYVDGSICFYLKTKKNPSKGDVIVFERKSDKGQQKIMKRVVASAGDFICTRHGSLYVNGHRVEESYASGRVDGISLRVPDSSVFVLGDNRNDSLDSRELGAINLSEICGTVYKLH